MAERTIQRPWEQADEPRLAAWLASQSAVLDAVTEAVKRPGFYRPLLAGPPHRGWPGLLLDRYYQTQEVTRRLTWALPTRAMLRLGAGDTARAWSDLLANFRLARHVAGNGTLADYLMAGAAEAITSNAALAFAERAKLSPEQRAACRRDLQRLPPFPNHARCYELAERAVMLDAVEATLGVRSGVPIRLDLAPVRAKVNTLYDRLADSARERDPERRRAAVARIERDSDAIAANSPALRAAFLAEAFAGRGLAEFTELVGDATIRTLMPAVGKVQEAADRAARQRQKLETAFAPPG